MYRQSQPRLRKIIEVSLAVAIISRSPEVSDLTSHYPLCAGVVKLVDTPDSKSGASDSVPVQVRPPVPKIP